MSTPSLLDHPESVGPTEDCSNYKKSYCPNPSLIANTNLNLSRLSAPMQTNALREKNVNNFRSNLLQKRDSTSSIPKRKRSSLSNTLSHHPSKLDLIDDTTLTSLPLPPPLKSKSRTSGSNSGHLDKDGTSSIKSGFSNIPLQNERGIDEVAYDETFENDTFDDDNEDEDEDDDHHDPIVLIEDYMTQRKPPQSNDNPINRNDISKMSTNETSKTCINNNNWNTCTNTDEQSLIIRKRSLATFKQRVLNNSHNKFLAEFTYRQDAESVSDMSTVTSTFNSEHFPNTINTHATLSNASLADKPKNKRTISSERPVLSGSRSENLEEIFGKIPGTDLLKYCELCEKPLYEISSIINNNKKYKKSKNQNAEEINKVNQMYNEFICGECVETYEEFFNEMDYQSTWSSFPEPKIGTPETNSSMKLLDIFQTIQNKYDRQSHVTAKRSFYQKPPVYKRKQFSETLMGRLNYLNSIAENSNRQTSSFFGFGAASAEQAKHTKRVIDLDWVKSLQSKLRWTWGFNGLGNQNSLDPQK